MSDFDTQLKNKVKKDLLDVKIANLLEKEYPVTCEIMKEKGRNEIRKIIESCVKKAKSPEECVDVIRVKARLGRK